MLAQRQSRILDTIVDEYIKTAAPISSGSVFNIGDFGISCPTIRNEMFCLTERGYLMQPHTSAGRVPTEKGYRFFVDGLISNLATRIDNKFGAYREQKKIQIVAEEISLECSDLVAFIDESGEFRYLGLKRVLGKPEFENRKTIVSFIEFLEGLNYSLMKELDNIGDGVEVFIGSENPFWGEKSDYSIILSRYDNDIIALLGPMRMNYRRNLELF